MAGEAAAEQLDWEMCVEEPQVYAIPELAADELTRARAKRFIGSVVTGASFEISYDGGTHSSLKEAAQQAGKGNLEAYRSVVTNVRSDVIERTIKAGHVTKVQQELSADGQLMQHGQTGRSIQANSLRFATRNPKMCARTEAETRNLFRLESANREGVLNEYVALVISRPADDMTPAELHNEGFFVDTMSVALQATSAHPDGSLTTESAFVAGKPHRSAPRHDAEAVVRLGQLLGVDLSDKTAAQIIDTPLLVPKSLMPNGVIDIVRLYDEAAGGTFFGQDKPPQDYLAYLEQCQQREAELEPTVQKIVGQLIAEAPDFQSPLDATQRLHELSETELVVRALTDKKIDTAVFGTESAHYIQAARYYLEQGNMSMVDKFMTKAADAADSSSCPGGGTKSLENSNTTGKNAASSNEDGDCEFTSNECPLCHKKKVRTVVKKLAGGKKYIKGSCGCTKIAA